MIQLLQFFQHVRALITVFVISVVTTINAGLCTIVPPVVFPDDIVAVKGKERDQMTVLKMFNLQSRKEINMRCIPHLINLVLVQVDGRNLLASTTR